MACRAHAPSNSRAGPRRGRGAARAEGTVTDPVTAIAPAPPARWGRFELAFVLVLVGLVVFVYVPIAFLLGSGLFFGGDWGQYILTAQNYLHPQPNLLVYPSPVLPVLYLPVALLAPNTGAIALTADVIGGVLLIGIFLAGYRVLSAVTASRWAGLTGAVFLATTPLLLDELGWSGQAQYLAILFGLLAVDIYLRRVDASGGWRPCLAVGALLVLGVLTEPYSTSFFLLTIALLHLLRHRAAVFRRAGLLRAALLVIPPVVALVGLSLANAALAGNTLGQPIAARADFLPMYESLFLRFTFHSVPLEVLYPVIGASYVLLWRRLPTPSTAGRWLVPAFVLAWIPVFLVLTPAVDTDRALYFALLPLAAMVAEITAALPSVYARSIDPARAERPPRPTRWGPSPRGRSAILPGLAVLVVVTVGVQVGVASHTYYASLTYYSYPSGALEELATLRGENGTLVLINPNLGSFSAAWASGLNTYFGPPEQPATFTRPVQQNAVITATLLADGPAWIAAGATWVVNGEPTWEAPAPAILEYQGYYLLETLALNDSQATIAWSPASEPSLNETVSLFSAPSIVASANPSNLSTVYTWSDLTVTKTLSVDPAGDVLMDLQYSFHGAVARELSIPLTAPALIPTTASASSPIPSSITVKQTYKNGFLPTTFTNTVRVSASGLTGSTHYLPQNRSVPGAVVTTLFPTSSNASTTYDVRTTITTGGLSSGPGTVATEAPVLSGNGISWIAVERSSPEQYLERFLNDPRFSLFSNETYYLIFATNWS
jgi:hypothetical protein